jgi:arylsulfatase A-like enzyme
MTTSTCTRPSSDAPNFLLVVMDTARADGFEPYGARTGSSPTVAQLASRGHAYENVFSTANWTVPSHASMLSGLQPGAAGLGQVPGGPLECRPSVEALRPRWLPEVLRTAGYRTAGVSTNLWVTDNTGFATGFDDFEVITADRTGNLGSRRIKHRIAWDFENTIAHKDDGASQCQRALEEFAGSHNGQPFFWFVNLTECHSPYLPPRPYNDLGAIGRFRAAEEARRYLTLGTIWRVCLGAATIPPQAFERMKHLYQRSIRYMDDWFAQVLTMLDRHRLLDDTVVMVTSDHGENLGESNLIGHAFSLDDRLIRVPFVSSHSELFDGEGAVSLADLPGAIARLAGVEDHPYENEGSIDGVAVSEMERLAAPSNPRAHEVSRSWQLGEEGFRRLTSSGWSACDGRFKLVSIEGDENLYDTHSDRLELRPLHLDGALDEESSAVATRLRFAANKVMNRHPEGLGHESLAPGRSEEAGRSSGESEGASARPKTSSAPPEVSPEELDAIADQMRRLGYL